MKKIKLLSIFVFLLSFSNIKAQYTITQNTNFGNIPPNYVSTDLITTGTQIISGSLSANTWSAQQTLPFDFKFFGTSVSTYYVSANGVLTFASTTPSTLPGSNTTLPSASLPDMSIAGMWDDFTSLPPTGSNDVVRVNVFGTAPNRQVWISWYSFETGNPSLSFAYWSIILQEKTNNIYVTDQYSNTGSSTGVTVGLQKDINTAISDANSPNILASGNGTSLADNDVWFFKADCDGTPGTGIDTKTACGSYKWIDGNTYTSSNNTATYTISAGSANGCDSIVTLDLTIQNIDLTVNENQGTLSSNESGANYQWIDCNNAGAIISGETNMTFTPTVTGKYAVIVSKGICSDTSDCKDVIINVTGVDKDINTISVYPNPSKDMITISGVSEVNITLSDLNGIVLINKFATDNITTINTTSLSNGVYLLKIGNSVRKISIIK